MQLTLYALYFNNPVLSSLCMKKSKVCVVSGASKGIGNAIAKRLNNDGYHVVAVDVNDLDYTGFKNADELTFIKCNVTIEEDVHKLFSTVIGNLGTVDVLVNNAGIIRDNMIWNMPEQDFDKVINVNLKGTWLMCKEAAALMKEKCRGRIINIASRAWLGNAGQSNYAASKAGVVALTRVLSLELGRYGIAVNAVAPGLIDTPMTRKLPGEVLDKLILAQPTRKIGSPDDVAHAVAFLADNRTSFINGQVIYVDGGKSVASNMI